MYHKMLSVLKPKMFLPNKEERKKRWKEVSKGHLENLSQQVCGKEFPNRAFPALRSARSQRQLPVARRQRSAPAATRPAQRQPGTVRRPAAPGVVRLTCRHLLAVRTAQDQPGDSATYVPTPTRRFRKPGRSRPPAADWLSDAPILTPPRWAGPRGKSARPAERIHARALLMVVGRSRRVGPNGSVSAGCTSLRVVNASPRAS
ncbi:hypothetical protein LEMLEM_LOCUS16750 [Lemmus lemmus]